DSAAGLRRTCQSDSRHRRPRRPRRLSRRRQHHAMGLRAAGRTEGAGVRGGVPGTSSWPGLSRPSTSLLRDRRIEIVPIWICSDNCSDLPRARSMLDVALALYSVVDVVEPFEIDQSLQSVPLGVAFDKSGAMLKHPTNKIVRHPDIQNAVRTFGQNINVATCHAE